MNNKSGIYKITSPSNKVYIGESINIEKRWTNYKSLTCKNQIKLYNSFKKHGVGNHIFEIIEECPIENLMCRERYWQEFYNVIGEKGLNLKLTSTTDKKQIFSVETIEKRKITIKERGGLYGSRNPMYGKKHTNSTKNKIRNTQIGKYEGDKNPMYGKFGKEHPAYGHKKTKEKMDYMKEINMYGGNPMAKMVIDLGTGIFYESASELAEIMKINKYTLRSRLNGNLKNNTNYKYC